MATIDSAPSAIVLAGCSAELFFDRLLLLAGTPDDGTRGGLIDGHRCVDA